MVRCVFSQFLTVKMFLLRFLSKDHLFPININPHMSRHLIIIQSIQVILRWWTHGGFHFVHRLVRVQMPQHPNLSALRVFRGDYARPALKLHVTAAAPENVFSATAILHVRVATMDQHTTAPLRSRVGECGRLFHYASLFLNHFHNLVLSHRHPCPVCRPHA